MATVKREQLGEQAATGMLAILEKVEAERKAGGAAQAPHVAKRVRMGSKERAAIEALGAGKMGREALGTMRTSGMRAGGQLDESAAAARRAMGATSSMEDVLAAGERGLDSQLLQRQREQLRTGAISAGQGQLQKVLGGITQGDVGSGFTTSSASDLQRGVAKGTAATGISEAIAKGDVALMTEAAKRAQDIYQDQEQLGIKTQLAAGEQLRGVSATELDRMKSQALIPDLESRLNMAGASSQGMLRKEAQSQALYENERRKSAQNPEYVRAMQMMPFYQAASGQSVVRQEQPSGTMHGSDWGQALGGAALGVGAGALTDYISSLWN